MDQERLLAVAFDDVAFGDAGEDVEDFVGVELEGFENTVDLGVLGKGVVVKGGGLSG